MYHTGELPLWSMQPFSDTVLLFRNRFAHLRWRNPFMCELCNAAFTLFGGIKTRLRTDTGERPFKYELYNAIFTVWIYTIINMSVHIRTRYRIAKNLLSVIGLHFRKSYDRNIKNDVTEWREPMFWFKSKLEYQYRRNQTIQTRDRYELILWNGPRQVFEI